MNIWLLLALFLPSCCYAVHDAQYECGPHGRFEYCIDGIPGCVIGCHCHPGYYFDTDSKICEPNIKLREDYRRHYLSEPTRIPVTALTPSLRNGLTSTTNPIDDKIEEITKDASDLGDWLYNQFFKTIENQVINNTDQNELTLTRRSGNDVPIKKKPKRKSRKYMRKHNKKRKIKKSGLKGKLLRITEDDSLFDSSSTSSSDDASSSSRDSSSDTSSESDRDHGHKKLLIYNKKPKPALPSFIFLPNMDTPFYPPIGIPPPPALPMYPMVPIPPMGPIFPYPPGTTPKCDNSNETSTNKISSSTTTSKTNVAFTTTKPKTIETTTAKTPETSTLSTQDTTTPQDSQAAEENVGRSKNHEYPGVNSKNEKWLKGRPNHGKQMKLLQTIKQKLKKRRNKVAPVDDFINTQNVDEPFLDNNYLQKSATLLKKQSENFEDDAPMEDVDFKYISELIHRANNTKRALKIPSNDIFLGIPESLTNRRNYQQSSDKIPQSNIVPTITDHRLMRRPQEPDDSYYTNLGRQIASMIRKIDTQGQRQLNIEIEQSKPSIASSQPLFNENIYSSRSYWDRLIRSTEKKYYPMYLKETGYFRDSNENLIDVEDKVKYVVSTSLPLSLPELENIINEMKYTYSQTESHNTRLIQMMPTTQFRYKLLRNPINTQRDDRERNDIKKNNIVDISKTPENNQNVQHKLYNTIPNNLINISASTDDTSRSKTNIPKTLAITPTRRSFNDSALKIPLFNHLQFLKSVYNAPLKPKRKNSDGTMPVNPMSFKHKNLNVYSGNNNNQYLYQKSKHPVYYLDNARKLYQPLDQSIKPSYFHHELHHFDYFD